MKSKTILKEILPRVIRSPISTAKWWWINRGNHKLAAVFNPQRRRSVKALGKYHNSHRGERCFILGNGPSLKKTDLSLLGGEITFGLNRIYLLFDSLGFTTTYLVVINTLVIEQFSNEIHPLMLPKFVSWRGRHWISESEDTFFLDTDYTPPPAFSEDVTGRVFEGATVTYVAMQLAFHMGFEEVILIGVDHSFSTEGTPNKTIISQGDDPNHFAPEYFGKGISWQLPDLKASEFAYEMAREAYDRAGRRILDATIGGNLNVFPKVDYLKLFNPCMDLYK
jgi:hypothetical protein